MHKLKKIAVMASMMSVLAAFAEPKPYTHSNYLEDSSEFRFAIIPDRFGADYRAKDYHTDFRGGFTNAIRVVNLLRPNFVMSIGDLIPYGWLEEASIRQQHRELKADLDKIVPPFYYVVGNHDICKNEGSTKVWKENWGKDTYYSFIYRNCLFIALNSCDLKANENVRNPVADAQYAWFKSTLEKHANVRWTFIFMHHPAAWVSEKWLDFELKNLKDRKYTVFAGDWHHYLHVKRHGCDYYVLGTAGGAAGGGLAGKDMDKRSVLFGRAYGELDHVMWITMTADGPVIANIDVTGVLNHDFVNQKNTKSLDPVKHQLDYPQDPEITRSIEARKKLREDILSGKVPAPVPDIK